MSTLTDNWVGSGVVKMRLFLILNFIHNIFKPLDILPCA